MSHFLRADKILSICEAAGGFLIHAAGSRVPVLVSHAWMFQNEATPHGYLVQTDRGGRTYLTGAAKRLLFPDTPERSSDDPATTHEPTTKLKWITNEVGEVLMQYWTPKNAATLTGVWREIPVE